MPLPVGTWNINANGTTGTLIVGSTTTGTFNGTVFGQPLAGFFDETEQEFSFIRVTHADVSTFEVYHGTLFSFSPSTSTLVYTLAGTFRTYPAAGATAPLSWSAQMSQKLKEKEGKDGKDKEQSKDNKDFKDRKDAKEGGKEVEKHPKDKELEALPAAQPDQAMMLDQLATRLSALEQQVAVGQSFIAPSERPVVGAQGTSTKSSSS